MRRSGGQGAIVVAALMGLLGLIGVATVRGQAQPGTRVPMAEEVFKNIQVLKGIPEDQFMSTMGIFASSLGKNCSECHGEERRQLGALCERHAVEAGRAPDGADDEADQRR